MLSRPYYAILSYLGPLECYEFLQCLLFTEMMGREWKVEEEEEQEQEDDISDC